MTMSCRISRRRFLQTTTALGATGFWTGRLTGDEKKVSANDRLQVGIIGISGQGTYNINELAKTDTTIVALCDVYESFKGVAEIRKRFPQAKFFVDYRKMVEEKGLDAVLVATPDHSHAPATVMALKAGLHVYCEKPLTHTVSEARIVAQIAAENRRVTQMGTQIHAGNNYRRVVELIQSGAIGPVGEVHVWCAKVHAGGDRPKDKPEIPQGLHYDLWLGPAPDRPYHSAYIPFHWRGWWDFGGGTLADMACHYMDLPLWALKLRHPEKVSAEGAPVHPESAARWVIARWEFPARDTLPPVKLTWYDGGKRPKAFEEYQLPKWGDGVLFVGEKGLLIADYNKYRLLPEKDFAGYTPPKPFLANSIGHHKEWVEACKTGATPTCHFGYSGALTETVLLGIVAYRSGKPFSWDPKNLQALNQPDADQFIHHHYRKGWTL
jgi:predicted dehydrogenase